MNRIILIMLLFLFVETGCKLNVGGRSNPGDLPDQTRILKAYAEPSTVAPGDTVECFCIISDSTNTRFKFYWYIPRGTPIGGKDTTYYGSGVHMTSVNRIKWKAPNLSGGYDFDITVDDNSQDSVAAEKTFSVSVKQK